MEKSDWHIFLAVVREGSTLAASRQLRVSQSTASRRIDALEAALGLRLFERRSSGYVLTDSGTALVPRAEAIERAVADALTSVRQQKRGLTGQIRFTTPAAFGQTFMVPAIREFRLAYPDIQVELVASEALLDLSAGEADVALRAGPRPTVAGLVARRVLVDGWSVYCSRDYVDKFGVPKNGEELGNHTVIGLPKAFWDAPISHWMDETVPESAVVVRQHDVPGLLAGLRSGVGVGLMSDMVAEADGTLVKCFVPPVIQEIPVWLVTTERLRKEPRIRALMDFLAGYLAQGRYRAQSSTSAFPAGTEWTTS